MSTFFRFSSIRIASHCNRSAKWPVVPAPVRNLSRIRASGQYRDDFNEVRRHVRLKGNRVPLYPNTIPQGYSTNADVACPSNGAFIALFLIARQIDAANVANPIPTFECGHRSIPRSYRLAKLARDALLRARAEHFFDCKSWSYWRKPSTLASTDAATTTPGPPCQWWSAMSELWQVRV